MYYINHNIYVYILIVLGDGGDAYAQSIGGGRANLMTITWLGDGDDGPFGLFVSVYSRYDDATIAQTSHNKTTECENRFRPTTTIRAISYTQKHVVYVLLL